MTPFPQPLHEAHRWLVGLLPFGQVSLYPRDVFRLYLRLRDRILHLEQHLLGTDPADGRARYFSSFYLQLDDGTTVLVKSDKDVLPGYYEVV